MVFIPQYEQRSDTPFSPMGGVPIDNQVGEAVEGQGAQGRQTAGQLMDLADHSAAQAAANTYNQAIDDLTVGTPEQPGVLSLKGADAAARAPQVIAQLDALRAKTLAGLKSGPAQRMFAEMADDQARLTKTRMWTHVQQTQRDAQAATHQPGVEWAVAALASSAGRDLEAQRIALLQLRTAIHGLSSLQSEGSPEAQASREKTLYADQVAQVLGQRDPSEAQALAATLMEGQPPEFQARLKTFANARAQVSATRAIVTADTRPDWIAQGLDPETGADPWAEAPRDDMGMLPNPVVLARARAYAAGAGLSPDEREALLADVQANYRREQGEANRRQIEALRRYGDLAKHGGEPGGHDVGAGGAFA